MADDPRNPDLERAILTDPDDAENFSVLADWLEGQGDPRAQLIRMQLKPRPAPTRNELDYLAKHQRRLVGGLSKADETSWLYGFVCDVKLQGIHVYALDHPSTRFLRGLEVLFLRSEQVEPLAKRLRRTLRSLSLMAIGAIELAPLLPAIGRLRRLTSLNLSGSFDLRGIALPPSLERLNLSWGDRDGTAAIARVAGERFALRELGLSGTLEPAAVVAMIKPYELTSLRLRTSQVDEVLVALSGLPAAATIRSLDLSHSGLGAKGVDALVVARSKFRALQELDITGCYVESERLQALELDLTTTDDP